MTCTRSIRSRLCLRLCYKNEKEERKNEKEERKIRKNKENKEYQKERKRKMKEEESVVSHMLVELFVELLE